MAIVLVAVVVVVMDHSFYLYALFMIRRRNQCAPGSFPAPSSIFPLSSLCLLAFVLWGRLNKKLDEAACLLIMP